jgi:hypothetical protein
MSIDDDSDDFHNELVDCMCSLVRVVSRMHVLKAFDDPSLAALLARSHAVLERLTDVDALNEPISFN